VFIRRGDDFLLDLKTPQGYRVPDVMRHEYAPGVNEVAIALAHWPETAEVLAAIAKPKLTT
jgi:hypothetical protein